MASHDDGWTKKPSAGGSWSRIDADDAQWNTLADGSDCDQWSEIDAGGSCLDFDGHLCWILDTGRWSDPCFWRDLSLWNDGTPFWGEVAA